MSIGGALRFVVKNLMGGPKAMLKPGDKAPDFQAVDHQERPFKLSELRGKKVVLWFYPKADTPG